MFEIKKAKSRSRRLRPGEEERLLDAADPYTKDLIVAALETGCRGGELRAILWSDVTKDSVVLRPEITKDREARVLAISPALKKILDRRRKGPDGKELPADTFVFGNEIGEPVSRRLANRWWNETCRAAKIDDLHFHDLRREFGSTLKDLGVPLADIRDALGHSNVTMTNTYLAAESQSVKKAIMKNAAHRARKQMKVVGR